MPHNFVEMDEEEIAFLVAVLKKMDDEIKESK